MRPIGVSPIERGKMKGSTCPDIFELADGSFAVIGTDMTAELEAGGPLTTPTATAATPGRKSCWPRPSGPR